MSPDESWQIRLEVTKVAHRPDRDVESNIDRIDGLVQYVMNGKKATDDHPNKHSGKDKVKTDDKAKPGAPS